MFKLTVATQDRYLFHNDDVSAVTLPGHSGELNVLPGHAPLMTTLVPGIVTAEKKDGSTEQVAICWGYCQINSDGVDILAETAVTRDEIDIEQVKSAKEEAEKALADEALDEKEFQAYFKRLKREEVRYAFANTKS